VAQWAENLPRKYKALSSNPYCPPTKELNEHLQKMYNTSQKLTTSYNSNVNSPVRTKAQSRINIAFSKLPMGDRL
jgi:dihydroorotate dehydrogenase